MLRCSRIAPARIAAGASLTVALAAALLSSCILDLDGLSTGGAGGSGATGGSGGTGGGGAGDGGGGGDTNCALLDCCPPGEVVEVARGPGVADLPRGIVVRSEGVYWANLQGNNVVRRLASGGPVEELAAAVGPRGIALSGEQLAWTAEDGVYLCPLGSCAAGAKKVASSLAPGSLRWIAFDGATLAFTDQGMDLGDGRARSCSVDGCEPVDLADSLLVPEGVALSGPLAFWVDQGNGNQNGTVTRSPKATSTQTQLAAARVFPSGVAVDETFVYWTEQTDEGRVFRCPFASGYCEDPDDIAPDVEPFARPGDIAIAGGRIYWGNVGDGSIVSCPQPGCDGEAPTVHVTGRQGLSRIAVGSSCLFWTENGGGGAVMKTAR